MSDINTRIHNGDIGAVINMTLRHDNAAVDISTATTKKFKFKRPDDTTFEKTAEWGSASNGTDGMLKYTTASGDINAAGDWSVQAYIVMPSFTGHASEIPFKVEDVIAVS